MVVREWARDEDCLMQPGACVVWTLAVLIVGAAGLPYQFAQMWAVGKRERWVLKTVSSQTSKMESYFSQYWNGFLCLFVGFFALVIGFSLGWLFFALSIYFVFVSFLCFCYEQPPPLSFLSVIQFAIMPYFFQFLIYALDRKGCVLLVLNFFPCFCDAFYI